MKPRRNPYTERGIRRVKCAVVGCNNRAQTQWQICADGNSYRALCPEHDVAINTAVMRLVWGRSRDADLKRYRKRVMG